MSITCHAVYPVLGLYQLAVNRCTEETVIWGNRPGTA